ncbi:MAG: hypothetical protein MJ231_04565 [bacterium]|nr:hypothetical protein [bacterium]
MKILSINSYTGNYSKTNFNGKYINGKYYTDEIIGVARKHLKENTMPSLESFKKDFWDCLGEAKVQPLEWAAAPFVWLVKKSAGEDDDTMELSRRSLGISTLGITELLKMPEAGIRKLVNNSKANKTYSEVLECMLAIKKEEG